MSQHDYVKNFNHDEARRTEKAKQARARQQARQAKLESQTCYLDLAELLGDAPPAILGFVQLGGTIGGSRLG